MRSDPPPCAVFPPPPRGLRGRATELAALSHLVTSARPARLALVGSGGSGKSMLACALGYRLRGLFGGRLDWFRVGPWDYATLVEMLALRFGTTRERGRAVPALRARLGREPRLLVLDNHEDDHATARLLDALDGTQASVIVTARRCLLSGVLVFPVVAPMVTSGRSAFARVASLTRLLRWNPLALDLADALVATRAASIGELRAHLTAGGAAKVRVIDHEDDLPEVSLLVDWAWAKLAPASRRMLGVLAHVEGDHVDGASLARLARVGAAGSPRALVPLQRWRLVQEPMRGRFALHAVVRHALRRRTKPAPARYFEHTMALLEAHPERLEVEQTHLFAAMDHAHRHGDLAAMLRVEALLSALPRGPAVPS